MSIDTQVYAGGSSTRPSREIPAAILEIAGHVERLEKYVSELLDHTVNVVRPMEPTVMGEGIRLSESGPLTELGGQMMDLSSRFGAANLRISELLSRLEI